jgi:DNA-binding CsgD family transcriptional regulator
MKVASAGAEPQPVAVTILRVPGARPDLFTLVHILAPIAEETRLARLLTGMTPRPEAGSPHGADAAVDGRPPLTPRETEILHHVAAGLQNKEIAQKLDLSTATVRNHVHNILDKLGVHSKLEAVSLAFRSGWISRGIRPADSLSRFTQTKR